MLGNDAYKSFVLDDLNTFGVHCLPVIDETRPTTNKNAIVADGYRLLKVDTLDNRSISDKIVEQLRRQIADTKTDAVVFSDFRHGIFNRGTIPQLIAAIPRRHLPRRRQPGREPLGQHPRIRGLRPDHAERARGALRARRPGLGRAAAGARAAQALEVQDADPQVRRPRHHHLPRQTRRSDYRAFFTIESFADRVVDAVGAGDALLAYATLALVATKNDVIASILGNMAAGIECEHDGNVPVTPDQVLKKIDAVEKQAHFE